ncbi:MAG TPA: GGDEF domain-containing protein [Terriglobales bacterium]|jgi:PleD family two-component response regulator|nr:GGDEF domain-containing protein [Terriglobales bacterium]
MPTSVRKLQAYLSHSPFMANLNFALESKTNISLIVGLIDHIEMIRPMFGLVSCDGVLKAIEEMLYQRFGHYSVRGGDVFLILLTGEEAAKAGKIAESIRVSVEKQGLVVPSLSVESSTRVPITMYFGVTIASSNWPPENGFFALLYEAIDAIRVGQQTLMANRVYQQPAQPLTNILIRNFVNPFSWE